MKLKDKLDRLSLRMPTPSFAYEPAVEQTCEPIVEQTCEPIVEQTCEPDVEQTCEPDVEQTCELVVTAAPAAGSPPIASAYGQLPDRLSTIHSLRARLATMRVERPLEPARAERTREPPIKRDEFWEGKTLGAAPRTEGTPRVPAAARVLPGETIETPHGPVCRVLVTHEEDHRHGTAQVSLACTVRASEVALLALDPQLETVDFARALYLDTETTGLAGGTGTLPFLIGMAWFAGERLVVEQMLLPRPGLEGPMLARLAERIAQASVVVSYNGKSFDWPLLRTRFILNRVPAPALPQHLDLLHCARRVYKSRLGSVRLVHLEQALMGFERVDDIPGELIPERYLSYLRGSSPGEMLTPILDHNRSDLIALPALLGEIVQRFDGADHACGADGLGVARVQDARDQLGFARVAARGAAPDRAIELAHRAAQSDLRGELAAHALFLVGELKLRKGDCDGAVAAFEGSAEASTNGLDRARAHHALAKLHEHKTKQCQHALRHATETAAFEGDDAQARRVARLSGRLARRAAPDA